MKKDQRHSWRTATRAIHVGEEKHGIGAPVTTPITRSSTFTFSSTAEMKRWAEGRSKAYIYTRYGNPTLTVAEEKVAALEDAEAAIVTASGMAAISSALLAVLKAGDEVIATRQLYGGTYRLMRDIFPRLGIHVQYVENDLAGIERLVNKNTRVLYTETPTNPTLRLVDLRKAAAIARRHKIVSIVDNTFATPVLQKPLSLGFDMAVHSATKYLGGHSDLIAGAVAGSQKFINAVRQMVIYLGGSMDPEVGFLLIRGIKTLEVRVERQCENAMAVARFLEKHSKVARVHYPGLRSHPDHALAKKQMCGFGSMLAFDMKGGPGASGGAARRVCDRVRVFLLAASLGGVESLVSLPLYTSHYNMSAKELAGTGVSPGTIRVSVGLEDPRDLIDDLKQALA
ncbi:MAG: aminotransferase class I/II-fold pyridoxal phosphate-dependent enzyme [Acidobacteria bacterium]|nr:aminotransferase class I/II-fold pyridoxal phosphate-dependent enzyme [Acidobacteriota bacterium]MBI3662164.1 aminotransferase class I/II-fold pyridoxal phosphate-dependent enzyme [Acidobacteriota bacterium]